MDEAKKRTEMGPEFLEEGIVRFNLFAPKLESVALVIEGSDPLGMELGAGLGAGFFSLEVPAEAGAKYSFLTADGRCLSDPVSRFQPEGVHGPSQLVDLSCFERDSQNWKGIPETELIIYELHVGTFTEEGTYRAAVQKLDSLVELGITAVELMPLAQAAGRWNWGYDGVNLFAPSESYGTPQDLASFVDELHRRGIAVILDVVYNHLGPEGNYLGEFGGYLSSKHTTPWGDAPDFDGDYAGVVRGMILENVRYWIESYGFDGLRVDATHCIADDSEVHIVRRIGEEVQRLERASGRTLHLIAESNIYDPELVAPLDDEGYGFSHLWCDDFLHSVFAQLQPGVQMSSRNYHPGSDLELVLRRGYVYRGTLSESRVRDSLTDFPDPVRSEKLVVSIQNHDFIGNHPQGKRLHQIAGSEAQKAAAALMLLSPSIPMLFMGEEYCCESPFYFFVDFGDADLRRAVERGRMDEHPQHEWDGVQSPILPPAFERSRLTPAESGDADALKWYRDLIQLRKSLIHEGVIHSSRLRAHWDQASSIALLQYESEKRRVFILVRLHPAGESPNPVRVDVRGKILAQRGCEVIASEAVAATFMAQPYAVIVGEGVIEF